MSDQTSARTFPAPEHSGRCWSCGAKLLAERDRPTPTEVQELIQRCGVMVARVEHELGANELFTAIQGSLIDAKLMLTKLAGFPRCGRDTGDGYRCVLYQGHETGCCGQLPDPAASSPASRTEEPPPLWKHAINECNEAHAALDALGADKTQEVPRREGEGNQPITIGLAERIRSLKLRPASAPAAPPATPVSALVKTMPSERAALRELLAEVRYRHSKWTPTSVDDEAVLQAQVNALERITATPTRDGDV